MKKFTKDEIRNIMYNDGIYDKETEEELLYEKIYEEIINSDMEKGSIDIEFVVKEIKTGLFYKAILGKSDWWKQDEVNADTEWEEVKEKIITKKIYE